MDRIDTLWTGAMWVLLGIAAAVVAWAVLGDWWRGKRASKRGITRGGERRRCGTCWYDMRGIAGLVCPECGREAKNERGLKRSRVRWRGMLVGLVVLVPAWVAGKMPEVRVGGWGRLVPVAVLALMAKDLNNWHNELRMDWATKQLMERHACEMPGWVGERVLAWRLARHWREKARREGRDWDVAVIDTSGVVRNRVTFSERPRSPMSWGERISMDAGRRCEYVVIPQTRSMKWALQTMIAGDSWSNHGDEGGRMREVGDRIVVACSPDRLEEVRSLVAVLATPQAKKKTADWKDMTIVGADLLPVGESDDPPAVKERVEAAKYVLMHAVEPQGWDINGGDAASMLVLPEQLVIRGPIATRERCLEALAALRECSPERRTRDFGEVSLIFLDRMPRVAKTWRGGWHAEEREMRELRDITLNCVHPDWDGWEDNGGDSASVGYVQNATCLIAGDLHTRRRVGEFIDALLLTVEGGGARRLGGIARPDALPAAALEFVAMWPIRPTLEAWGAMTQAEALSRVGPPDSEEDESWQRFYADGERAPSERAAATAALARLAELIHPQRKEEARLSIFGGVLVMWATRPELFDAVERELPELAKGPGGQTDMPSID